MSAIRCLSGSSTEKCFYNFVYESKKLCQGFLWFSAHGDCTRKKKSRQTPYSAAIISCHISCFDKRKHHATPGRYTSARQPRMIRKCDQRSVNMSKVNSCRKLGVNMDNTRKWRGITKKCVCKCWYSCLLDTGYFENWICFFEFNTRSPLPNSILTQVSCLHNSIVRAWTVAGKAGVCLPQIICRQSDSSHELTGVVIGPMHGYFQQISWFGILPNSVIDNLYFTALEVRACQAVWLSAWPRTEEWKTKKSCYIKCDGNFFPSNLPSESLNKHTGWCERK